ncbi:MAG: iron-sulfur cluster assembly accessory protein [Gammaproteobacteria bacterium]|nr:iron-sulfur cluster assembly accessory protein [Gammaproteobacteria bacterium]
MAVMLTESAAQRVRLHLQSRGEGEGLRIGVKTSGCSGLAYIMDYANEITDQDEVFESHGVKVIVEPDHLKYLDGIQVDYVQNGLSSSFQFNNPNVTEQCGCGESFTTS